MQYWFSLRETKRFNFNYYNPVKIYFGKGEEQKVGELADEYSKNKKALVLYSGDY